MHDFVVTIARSAADAGYRVALQREGGGSLAVAEVPAPNLDRLRETVQRLTNYADEPVDRAALTGLGVELANLLFPNPVRNAVFGELARDANPRPVRLRVRTQPAELADLPWEFAHFTGRGFACLQDGFHLLRHSVGEQPLPPPDADPLRVLVVWANPQTPRYPDLRGLADEVDSVRAALSAPECARLQVEVLSHVTPAVLQWELAARRPHILHFMGHGEARPTGGALVLQGANEREAKLLYGDRLADWLRETNVRLVFLSACQTSSPVRGVAEALMSRGIPAVVAMQLPLRDRTAGLFARAFYSSLLVAPSIEKAVSNGRQAVQGAGADWGVPVLYRADNTELFRTPPALTLPPNNLPNLAIPNFVGRESTLIELHTMLSSTESTPVALVGLSGLGKTQLAWQYAYEHLRDFPGGVFWLNASSRERLEHDLASLGSFFNLPAELPTADRMMLVRNRLQQLAQPALLVLDNVVDEKDLELLPLGGRCRFIVTTRLRYLARYNCRPLDLPALGESASLLLLQERRRADTPEELTAAKDIANRVGHLPLALKLVAHYIGRRRLTFAACLEQIAPTGKQLGMLEVIYETIALPHRSLSPLAQQVLATASCFAPRDIALDLLFAACETDDRGAFEETLADLEDFTLINREDDDRLRLHTLVANFAFGQMTDDTRSQTVGRVACVLAELLRQANDTLDWTRARKEVHHCLACWQLVAAHADATKKHALALYLGRYHDEYGDYAAALACYQQALAAANAAFGARDLQVAQCLRYLGLVEQWLGDDVNALQHEREALALAEELLPAGDPAFADFYNDLGLVLKTQGKADEALPWYEKGLALYESAHGRMHPLVASALSNLGMLWLAKNDAARALEFFREAKAIDEATLGPRHEMTAVRLNNLARALIQLNEVQEGLTHHRTALDIYESIHGQWSIDVAYSHRFIGNAHATLREFDRALSHYQQSLRIFEHLFGPEHARCEAVRADIQGINDSAAQRTSSSES